MKVFAQKCKNCKIGEIGVTQTVEKCIMVKRMQALKYDFVMAYLFPKSTAHNYVTSRVQDVSMNLSASWSTKPITSANTSMHIAQNIMHPCMDTPMDEN